MQTPADQTPDRVWADVRALLAGRNAPQVREIHRYPAALAVVLDGAPVPPATWGQTLRATVTHASPFDDLYAMLLAKLDDELEARWPRVTDAPATPGAAPEPERWRRLRAAVATIGGEVRDTAIELMNEVDATRAREAQPVVQPREVSTLEPVATWGERLAVAPLVPWGQVQGGSLAHVVGCGIVIIWPATAAAAADGHEEVRWGRHGARWTKHDAAGAAARVVATGLTREQCDALAQAEDADLAVLLHRYAAPASTNADDLVVRSEAFISATLAEIEAEEKPRMTRAAIRANLDKGAAAVLELDKEIAALHQRLTPRRTP